MPQARMIDTEEYVVLVDAAGREIGIEPKLPAHRNGSLHRAFSIYIVDGVGRHLLQKRAQSKYHSGGLWTNACCGHPRPGEATAVAAHRRLQEEMGFDCSLAEQMTLTYRAELPHNMIEHEFLHIFTGTYHGEIAPDPAEAEDVAWVLRADLEQGLVENPAAYTEWFKICFPRISGLL